MKIGTLVVVLALLTLLGRAAGGDEASYVVFPITTPLQRVLLFSTKADVYVQLDVRDCLHEGKFDLPRFESSTFREDLQRVREQMGGAAPSLLIQFRYADANLDDKATEAMENAVTKICKDAGFAKVSTGMRGEGETWQDKLAKFADLADDAGASETPSEDALVRVYPVRTSLSRFLLGESEYDCVIELRQPLDRRFTELSGPVRAAMEQQVAKFALPQKRKVSFRLTTTRPGQEVAERYFATRVGKPAPVQALLDDLGFESSAYTTSTSWSSPEDLLGEPAPDFTLPALAGGNVHLQEAIRGRVAVISFWGVACGPCRAEAPHLSALHRQHASDALAVIAVNGYDEPREVVDEYVRANGLTQPVALLGKKVGQELYQVGSYPVTFLVDRQGKVVDYHLGFEAGDEKILAAAVTRLLSERESEARE